MSTARPPEGAQHRSPQGGGTPETTARPPEGAQHRSPQGGGTPETTARPPEGAQHRSPQGGGTPETTARPPEGAQHRSPQGGGTSETTPRPPEGATNRDSAATAALKEWPLWEVFVRSKQGLDHKHCGSLHASDAKQALDMARDVYTRRQEGVSIWVVPSVAITASNPDDKGELFDPAADKIYRHPTFYDIPDEVGHM